MINCEVGYNNSLITETSLCIGKLCNFISLNFTSASIDSHKAALVTCIVNLWTFRYIDMKDETIFIKVNETDFSSVYRGLCLCKSVYGKPFNPAFPA